MLEWIIYCAWHYWWIGGFFRKQILDHGRLSKSFEKDQNFTVKPFKNCLAKSQNNWVWLNRFFKNNTHLVKYRLIVTGRVCRYILKMDRYPQIFPSFIQPSFCYEWIYTYRNQRKNSTLWQRNNTVKITIVKFDWQSAYSLV